MKKGVTLSILTITIIIMITIATTATVIGTNVMQTAAYEEFLSKINRVYDDVNKYVVDNNSLPTTMEIVSKEGLPEALITELTNNGDETNNLFVVDMSKLNVENVNIGTGNIQNMDVFIVVENTNNVYYLKGVKYKGNEYYGLQLATGQDENNTINETTLPVTTITLSGTTGDKTTRVTAKVAQQDAESGIDISKCRWIYTTSSDSIGTDSSKYKETFASSEETITLLPDQASEFYLHVLTVDKAGNKKETISDKITENYYEGELGNIIRSAVDYGRTINYEANGVTKWRVFYDTEKYVYLIATEELSADKIPAKLTDTIENGGAGARINSTYGSITWDSGKAPSVAASGSINYSLWLANWGDYTTYENGRCISYFLDETYWTAFKNTDKYGKNVVGAIGTPTLEMFVASWNAKGKALNDTTTYVPLTLTKDTYGYYINGSYSYQISTEDNLYIWSTDDYTTVRLASPSARNNNNMLYWGNGGYIDFGHYDGSYAGSRPVVCLKANVLVCENIEGEIMFVE